MQVVVDTDTGIDDALALLVLAARPEAEIVEVTTTHGNCATEQATANARKVLDLAGLSHVPVTGGLSTPLAGELNLAWFVHGHDGLGDCGEAPPPAPAAVAPHTAVERLLELAATRAGELDLIALGPLTNLGAALRVDPEVLTGFRSVTIMGGTGPRLAPGAPDPTGGVGDPNTYHDAAAARLVAAAPGNITLVGVDITMHTVVGADGIARLEAATTEHGRFAATINRFYLDFYERQYGRRLLTLHDPLTALVATGAPVGTEFLTGRAVVDGPAGEERCLLDPLVPGMRATRSVSRVDVPAAGDAVLDALLSPLPAR